MSNGARHGAYPSIVGSGNNGCVLHYTDNDAPLQDGNLVLIDAGCEYQHYAADITRTFPVSGEFSAPQKALYNIVLAANERLLLSASRVIHSTHLMKRRLRSWLKG